MRVASYWVLLAALVRTLTRGGCASLPDCNGVKIAVLDLATFADAAQGMPLCSLDNFRVDAGHGIVYLVEMIKSVPKTWFKSTLEPHYLGTHAASWYVGQAIRASQYYTEDLDTANAIYVDDYCYYIWYLAWVHSWAHVPEKRNATIHPGHYLLAGYQALMETPQWRATNGSKFVFYEPHPGFHSFRPIWVLLCYDFRLAMHIVMDAGMRNLCEDFHMHHQKLLVTPYIPNFINYSEPLATWQHLAPPRAERLNLIYAKQRCDWHVNEFGEGGNIGKKMRLDIARAVQRSDPKAGDLDVTCSEETAHVAFPDMYAAMQRAQFCLVLPGDSQSTRRLSEIFMAGCIPVFVGPPYNSFPLPYDIDYAASSVVLNISDYRSWMPQSMLWQLPADPADHALASTDAWFWIPDAPVTHVALSLENAGEIVSTLRRITEAEVDARLAAVEEQRRFFMFTERLTKSVSATNAVVAAICRVHGGGGARRAQPLGLQRGPPALGAPRLSIPQMPVTTRAEYVAGGTVGARTERRARAGGGGPVTRAAARRSAGRDTREHTPHGLRSRGATDTPH